MDAIKIFLTFSVIAGFISSLANAETFPDRRREQFPKEDAYLIVPLPYSYPGIGEGFFLMGSASNIGETTADAFYIEVTGDIGGHVAQLDEFPIIDDELLLSLHIRDINQALVNFYEIRGMNGSDGNNYKLLDVSQADETVLRLDYSLNDRRYNFYLSHSENTYTLDAIRDADGNTIQQIDNPDSTREDSNLVGFFLDYTDDYQDPHTGIRFGIEYTDRPAEDKDAADYYVINVNLLYYFPMADIDTLVLNYYQSDAHVNRIGNVDPTYIRNDLGLNCGTDPECLQIEQQLVDSQINANTYGSAMSLGGLSRLRSYPQGRYQGGHAGFIGAEYRWNLTEEATPFNYFFWKDVRTGKQIAFFAEAGSVSEKSSDLWEEKRYSYGVGFRLLTASGSVYRADIAAGDEGTEVAIFFFYPWK